MIEVISVAPTEGGWTVDAKALAAPLVFLSGGKAEAAAKRLAEAVARGGRWAEVRVHLHSGEVFGRFLSPPWPGPAADGVRVLTLAPRAGPPLGLGCGPVAAA